MQSAVVVTGRMTSPTRIELDEPLASFGGAVEVILRPRNEIASSEQSMAEFLRGLAPGTRSKTEIDRQILEERADWKEPA